MSDYFQSYGLCGGDEAPHGTDKPVQRNPDVLPFDALSGRRFEVLCYRLKKREHPGAAVHLMQGTGDSGRDVVVFRDGVVFEVVQCKNQSDRLTKPQLITEIGKLALCHHVEPGILHPKTKYEVWCPSGLSGPAADLINTWPSRWSEAEVATGLKRLLKLPTFSHLTWAVVKPSVLHDFPKLLAPRKLEGVDITERLRTTPDIFDDFFVVHKVVSEADIRRVLAEVGWRQLTDSDVRHLVDRVESFGTDERLRLLTSYVLGIKAEFIVAMTEDELKTFYGNILRSVYGNMKTILDVGIRKAYSLLSLHIAMVTDKHPAFLYVMMQLVHVWVATRCVSSPSFIFEKHAEYHNAPIEEQYQAILEHIWEKRILTKEPGLSSDHDMPLMIIRQKFSSREAFEQRMQAAYFANRRFIQSVFADLDAFMPRQIVVISDMMSVLDGDPPDRTLIESFKRTMLAFEGTTSTNVHK